MTTDFKQAIPTVYQGIEFRSRLEAQTAFLIASLGYEAQYEPVSLMLDDGIIYRPDFWVPELRLWVEARGYSNEKGDRQIAGFAKWIAEGRVAPDMTPRPMLKRQHTGNVGDWLDQAYSRQETCGYLVLGDGVADFYTYDIWEHGATPPVTAAQVVLCNLCQRYFISGIGMIGLWGENACSRCLEGPSNPPDDYGEVFVLHARAGVIYMDGDGKRFTLTDWKSEYAGPPRGTP